MKETNSYADISYKKWFYVDFESLVKIKDILKNRIWNKCKDDIKLTVKKNNWLVFNTSEFSDIEEEYNSNNDKINHISISTHNEDVNISITFDRKWEKTYISILWLDKDTTSLIYWELKTYITTMILKWWDIWTNEIEKRYTLIIMIVFTAFMFRNIFNIYRLNGTINNKDALNSTDIVEKLDYLIARTDILSQYQNPYPGMLTVLVALIAWLWLIKIIKYLYPKCVFHFWDEKNQYSRKVGFRKRFRWSLVTWTLIWFVFFILSK